MKTIYLHRIELGQSIEKYLESLGFNVTDDESHLSPDFIFYSVESDIYELEETFELKSGLVKLIYIGELKEKDKFFLSGGELILSQEQIQNETGYKVLNRFFSENIELRLADRNVYKDKTESVIITNHLQTGMSFDRIATSAFESNHNPILIRSYLDHVIGYFTYLSQSSLGSIPFELEWYSDEDDLVINTYLKVKNFSKEYLADCFGDIRGAKALHYLLTIASNSCEHLDIKYFEKSERLCFTGYWNGSALRSSSSTLSIKNITTLAQRNYSVSKELATLEEQIKMAKDTIEIQENLYEKKLPHGFHIRAEFRSKQLIENREKAKKILTHLVKVIHASGGSLQGVEEQGISEIISQMPNEYRLDDLSDESLCELKLALKSAMSTSVLEHEVSKCTLDFALNGLSKADDLASGVSISGFTLL